MENSFSAYLFNESKDKIKQELGLDSGIDFESGTIVNETLSYNRNGITSILEVLFESQDDEEEINQTLAFITKQLYQNVDLKNYKKAQDKFISYIDKINSDWKSRKKDFKEKFQFPDQISGLKIDKTFPDTNLIQFDTLNRYIRRENAELPGNIKYKLTGYCLGRFHSTEHVKLDLKEYETYFKFLEDFEIDKKEISQWKKDLANEPGSKYIIGDCTLNNIQYSSINPEDGKLDSLCIVDPILLENRFRGEDLGSILASLTRDLVDYYLRKYSTGLRKILGKTFRNIINAGEEILFTYFKLHPNLLAVDSLSVDFFLGTNLLQFSSVVTENDDISSSYTDLLKVLGIQFLTDKPFTNSIKS